MFTQTVSPLKLTISIFILFSGLFSQRAFSQNFVSRIRYVDSPLLTGDRPLAAHLEASIEQPDKDIMKFRVTLSNPTASRTVIAIRRQQDVLFSEVVRVSDYMNVYDMSQLEDGVYEFEISSGKEKFHKTIVITTITQVNRQAMVN